MKTPRSPGFASLFRRRRKLPLQGDIRERVHNISKQFTGAGWKHLPQELVDEILGYLLGDLGTLKACSLTCKPLFGATRPIIHRRVFLVSMPAWMVPRARRECPDTFERLTDAERSGLLRYVEHLTFKLGDGSFHPVNMQNHLPHLRAITNLHSLTLVPFRVRSFIPVLNECFGMFGNTLRHLDVRNAYGTEQQLLYIVSQFSQLEDLTIISPSTSVMYAGDPVPAIKRSPPLRGSLVLVQANSMELSYKFARLPGGLNCSSLELVMCKGSQIVLDACGHSVMSMSYLWFVQSNNDVILLNFKRSVVLEKLELTIKLYTLSSVPEWIHQTLQTITSPLFNELVIWVLCVTSSNGLLNPTNSDGWKAVDTSLDVLARRNPDFRVVFRGDFSGEDHDMTLIRQRIEDYYLPLASLKGFVMFERVPDTENRLFKCNIL